MEYSSNRGCGEYLIQRGVTSLVHVTDSQFLASILEEGIKPYNPIFKEGFQRANSSYNQKRVHCTIEYPHPYIETENPVAILLSPQIADRHDASFTVTTSALYGVSVCIGAKEIEKLFAERVRLTSGVKMLTRHAESPANMTTSQKAEARFSEIVLPDNFVKLVFPSLGAVIEYENSRGHLPSTILPEVDERLFAFSPILCGRAYHKWFRQFEDNRRIVTPMQRTLGDG